MIQDGKLFPGQDGKKLNKCTSPESDCRGRREQLIFLRNVGKLLLTSQLDDNKPLGSLWPLGMALLEGFNLFSVLLSGSYEGIDNLFDGGEDKGPNIDTRLKFIRDLFSASERAIYLLASLTKQISGIDSPKISNERVNWVEIISPHIEQMQENTLTEVVRLIDETLDALLSVGLLLNVSQLSLVTKEIWEEVYRHLKHVRDHFDYAETYLLDVLRPATE